jgi:hypothetical protein
MTFLVKGIINKNLKPKIKNYNKKQLKSINKVHKTVEMDSDGIYNHVYEYEHENEEMVSIFKKELVAKKKPETMVKDSLIQDFMAVEEILQPKRESC